MNTRFVAVLVRTLPFWIVRSPVPPPTPTFTALLVAASAPPTPSTVGLGVIVVIVTRPLEGTPPTQFPESVQSVLFAPVQVCDAAGDDISIASAIPDALPRRLAERFSADR
jgi:hypothetical protein